MTTTETKEPGILEPEKALELVVDACHRPAAEIWARVDERVDATVHAALREAIDAHARIAAEAGILDALPEDPEARLDSLRRYRHGVADEVLPSLELALVHHRPTLLVPREIHGAFEEALEASRSLPFRSEVRWGSGALEPLPTDGFGRRLRKSLARVLSAARKPEASRVAPLRAVALHHLEARVAPALDSAVAEAARGWASWVARLERGSADWAAEVLPVLAGAGTVPTGSVGASVDPRDEPDEDELEDAHAGPDWPRLAAGARAFEDALRGLMEASPHEKAREALGTRLEPAAMRLSSDLRAVGSFVHSPPETSTDELHLAAVERVHRSFEPWDVQTAARLHMYRSFLEILLGTTAVLDRLEARTRQAVLDPQAELGGCLGELETLVEEARRRAGDGPGTEVFRDLRARADEVVERAVALFPEPTSIEEALEEIVSDTVDALQAIVRQSPTMLVLHRLHAETSHTIRPDETRSVPFQDQARQSLDAMRIERIRSAVLELGVALGPIRASLLELPDVLQFAFDAAQSELTGGDARASGSEEIEGRPEERAGRLALEALKRALGVLRDVPPSVEAVLERTRDRVDAEISTGAGALLARLGAGRMQSQLLRARSNVWELWLRLMDRVEPALKRFVRSVRFRYLHTRRATRRIQRSMRGLVGDGGHVSDARAARTIRAFATADSGPRHVPLVYQRLFSMEPVKDAGFLVGRSAELADVLKRWRRWRDEDEVPLVVRGYPGVGVTSFLNGCSEMLENRGASIVRLDVPERLLEEAALASLLGGALGVGAAETLAELARRVLEAPRGASPDVVILDGLEHIYLRVPGGTDLLERLLTLMSETEPRTFWLAGVGQPAWQLMGRVEPTAVSQVDGLQIPPLTLERLRETTLQRHRRSGLRLRFLEPREGRAFLRRRARRLRGTEGHQRLLEEDFFEQLQRVSLGNLKLAMFHWLLSADFESSEGEVLVHPLSRPDFSVLEGLDDTQNFALKALLEHRTLTLEEHCRIFRVGRQESYQVFESLQNRRLVEEMTPEPSRAKDGSELERASRYRIRPLLVGAVSAHLRKRNIVH